MSVARDRFRALSQVLIAGIASQNRKGISLSDNGMEDYARLQRRLMLATLLVSLVAALVTALRFDLHVAAACWWSLCRSSLPAPARPQRGPARRRIPSGWSLPVGGADASDRRVVRLPQLDLLPAFLGFLLYKPALIVQAVIDG